jgi:hypothetical protein
MLAAPRRQCDLRFLGASVGSCGGRCWLSWVPFLNSPGQQFASCLCIIIRLPICPPASQSTGLLAYWPTGLLVCLFGCPTVLLSYCPTVLLVCLFDRLVGLLGCLVSCCPGSSIRVPLKIVRSIGDASRKGLQQLDCPSLLRTEWAISGRS